MDTIAYTDLSAMQRVDGISVREAQANCDILMSQPQTPEGELAMREAEAVLASAVRYEVLTYISRVHEELMIDKFLKKLLRDQWATGVSIFMNSIEKNLGSSAIDLGYSVEAQAFTKALDTFIGLLQVKLETDLISQLEIDESVRLGTNINSK